MNKEYREIVVLTVIGECLTEKMLYRQMFHIIAYVTKMISITKRIDRPQYLDYLDDTFYDNFIDSLKKEDIYVSNVIDKVSEYLDSVEEKMMERMITQDEIMPILSE